MGAHASLSIKIILTRKIAFPIPHEINITSAQSTCWYTIQRKFISRRQIILKSYFVFFEETVLHDVDLVNKKTWKGKVLYGVVKNIKIV